MSSVPDPSKESVVKPLVFQPKAAINSAANDGAGQTDFVEMSLYEVQKKIYPRAVHGWFAAWRWALVWFTQLIFYGLPWMSWNGRQAVLFDLLTRKFYIFGLVLWPQDFIYLAALLVISAFSLFLFTAIGGRLWCGYACPQTVYTEIFMWVEHKIQGDRARRMKLDSEPFSIKKFVLKSTTQLVWIAIALWTGFTFVGYFTSIHDLANSVMQVSLGPWEAFWMFFYAFATYGNAGYMREQVCKYMCPYARFQGAMFDRDTLVVTYDYKRGEPRGGRSKKDDQTQLGLGSCVDCSICVQVCPVGIDIRQGQQYECIGCAACIDACDQVMDKMNYPRGLIRYDTENGLEEGLSREELFWRMMRPRTLIYTGILSIVAFAMMTTLVLRVPLKVDVIRDRGSMGKIVDDGAVENIYRLQIMNTQEVEQHFEVAVDGLDGAKILLNDHFVIPGATSQIVPIRVQVPAGVGQTGSNKLYFEIRSMDNEDVKVKEKSVFLIPR
ncbi:cytochrome c oxidase accessory protein CcoG [Ampullimonas aquatilis]|uniref:cytochrome c oxidase accessory protein CcoG n=1 Tax=Ampullimonas aquatilis TaxID=1341549 RepID=UPI003C789204